ncbi:MAG: helix-turn-helix transcriptional regulator [Burkholderiaceae bacterium]|nr:MAG: helix-turn-helix transcriptional regulator [Burkholderiaceae bacterium]
MSLGEQIKKYRLALELNLDHLAELTDVSPGTLSALAVRGSDRSKYAAPIAKGLGLTLEELLDSSADHLAKSFDHIDDHRPRGWSPSPELVMKVAANRRAMVAMDPSPIGGRPHARHKEIVWPFTIVTYSRIDKIRRHYSVRGMPPAMAEIDRYLDALVTRWENEMNDVKSTAA